MGLNDVSGFPLKADIHTTSITGPDSMFGLDPKPVWFIKHSAATLKLVYSIYRSKPEKL